MASAPNDLPQSLPRPRGILRGLRTVLWRCHDASAIMVLEPFQWRGRRLLPKKDMIHRPRLLLLSSHTRPALTSAINHQAYSLSHGYDYLFDATPYRTKSRHDQKLHSVIANLPRCDWLMWLDDDAYVMNQSIAAERFIPEDDGTDFVFCSSPDDTQGIWTVINSGIFFVRNSPRARDTLEEAVATDLVDVDAWWREGDHGYFTNGDQDKLVYVFERKGMLGSSVRVVRYSEFNARPRHFTDSRDQHFICHFAGVPDKRAAIAEMRRRFDLDPYLLPEHSLAVFGGALKDSMFNAEHMVGGGKRNGPRTLKGCAAAVRRAIALTWRKKRNS